jgi:hypothetical protein
MARATSGENGWRIGVRFDAGQPGGDECTYRRALFGREVASERGDGRPRDNVSRIRRASSSQKPEVVSHRGHDNCCWRAGAPGGFHVIEPPNPR